MTTDLLAKEVRSSAMNLLSRREYSFRELVQKLSVRFPREAVLPQLERLRSEGLQNDERFIESFIYRRCQRGSGPVRIRYELQQRGIASELIGRHLHEGEYWSQLACQVKERKFGVEPPRNQKERARQIRFLAQRGFSMEQINSAIS